MGKHKTLTAVQHLQRGKEIRIALAGLRSIKILGLGSVSAGTTGKLHDELDKIRCEADSVVCSVLKNDNIDPKKLGLRVYYGQVLDDVECHEFIDLWCQSDLAK